MKDQELKIFTTLLKEQSFTATAHALGISQHRVSEAVAGLEKKFGQPLIQRGSHVARPTLAGEKLGIYAHKILNLKVEALEVLEKLKSENLKELKLGASSVPGNYLLPKYLSEFQKIETNLRAKLVISNSRQVCDLVQSGEVEVGFVGAKYPISGVSWQPWKKDRLVLVIPEDHKWSSFKSVSLSELIDEPLLLREGDSGTRSVIQNYLSKQKIPMSRLNVVAELGGAEALKRGVQRGMGVAFLSSASVETEIQQGSLLAKPIADFPEKRDLFIITSKERKLSDTAKQFINFVVG